MSSKKSDTAKAAPANATIVAPVATPTSANTTAPASGVRIIKKISNAIMKEVPIGTRMRLAGIVRKAIGKETNFGPYTEFQGDFAAKIGAVLFKAHKLLLPAIADMELASQYAAAIESVGEGAVPRVEFVFDLFKSADAKSNTGYVWVIETVKELTTENDRAAQLLTASEKEKPLAITA